ncbi:group II intron maturase-specific domain-containing protein [Endozoicomonas sp. ALC013]|uniref:group II intron maturase-specific domain-containing protein n=1 Tax=Endozoicomonas sp. ALC013 TaxID=3403076 RepID=UPI003BB74DF0
MTIIKELNPVLRGFANYFKIANCRSALKGVMSWVRRRLRCIQLKQWKKPAKLHGRLKQLGYKPPSKYIKMRSWRNAASPLAHPALPDLPRITRHIFENWCPGEDSNFHDHTVTST